MRFLILIPTYNEKENITPICEAVLAQFDRSELSQDEISILVIDDNSPDGTAKIVNSLIEKHAHRIHLLSRAGKEGLGRAYLAGFAWGLERNYDVLTEMDADFSHRPEDLVQILLKLKKNSEIGFAVGSRWVRGGGTINWGILRKIISRGGSFYSRCILGYKLTDWTGGFNAWRASTLKRIDLSGIRSNGYSFQIELKYRAFQAGLRGEEVPILFEDRRVGQSKMSGGIVLEAFSRVWKMRFN